MVKVDYSDLTLIEMINPFSRAKTQSLKVRRGKRDHTGRPLLYFAAPHFKAGGGQNVAICVEKCPTVGNSSDDPSTWVCTGKYYNGPPNDCLRGVGEAPECKAYRASYVSNLSSLKACNDPMLDCDVCFPAYPTVEFFSMCIPDPGSAISAFGDVLSSMAILGGAIAGLPEVPSSGSTAETDTKWLDEEDRPSNLGELRALVADFPSMMVEDLTIARPVIAGCISGAIGFSLLFLLIIRLLGGAAVWVVLLSIAAAATVGAVFLWGEANAAIARKEEERANSLRIGFYTVVVVGGLYIVSLMCLRRNISKAAKTIRLAALAMANLPLLIISTPFFVAFSLGALMLGSYLALLLMSTGTLRYGSPGFGHITLDGWTEALLFSLIGCTFWLVVFMRHLMYAVVGGAVSTWYKNAHNWSSLQHMPVLSALGRALRYHSGSIALGSGIISLVKLVRLLFFIVRRRLRVATDRLKGKSVGAFTRACCCYAACCLRCFERCLDSLSRFAYAQIMISKTPFCQSASQAFATITRNFGNLAALRLVAGIFLLLGKLLIAAAATAVGCVYMQTQEPYSSTLYSLFAPASVIAIASLAVAMVILGVYNMAIDTVFLNMCIDRERSDNGLPRLGQSTEISNVLGKDFVYKTESSKQSTSSRESAASCELSERRTELRV